MPRKKDQPNVHKELKDFDIQINTFGELKSNLSIDKINEFLNKHVPDKRVENEGAWEEE
jgi:hypothetical protein